MQCDWILSVPSQVRPIPDDIMRQFKGGFDLRNQKRKEKAHTHTHTTKSGTSAKDVEGQILSSSAQGGWLVLHSEGPHSCRLTGSTKALHSEAGEIGADRRK